MNEYVVVHAPEGGAEEYVGSAQTLEEARALAANPGPSTPAHLYQTARAAGIDVPGCAAPPDWYTRDLEPYEWAGADGYYAIVRKPSGSSEYRQ